jgi:hypothetical protein
MVAGGYSQLPSLWWWSPWRITWRDMLGGSRISKITTKVTREKGVVRGIDQR